jgi:hypothetical protein
MALASQWQLLATALLAMLMMHFARYNSIMHTVQNIIVFKIWLRFSFSSKTFKYGTVPVRCGTYTDKLYFMVPGPHL